ncbi:hypothetical protein YSA_05546 [Pseudomonas putida ND6]|uniref:Uncharacterized protein n=1 Tax=Pseudomonas putida ND6 TaxID=231023 RepID=I3UWA0_PSEPU|nr:hypothetical protein YSA_05546 [Pseudomonas putida ND6]
MITKRGNRKVMEKVIFAKPLILKAFRIGKYHSNKE